MLLKLMCIVFFLCLIWLSPDEEIEQLENARLTTADSDDGDKNEANEGDEEADDDDADEAGPSYHRKVSAAHTRAQIVATTRQSCICFAPNYVGGAAASDVSVAVAGRQQLL